MAFVLKHFQMNTVYLKKKPLREIVYSKENNAGIAFSIQLWNLLKSSDEQGLLEEWIHVLIVFRKNKGLF